jgi:hypothetical protein
MKRRSKFPKGWNEQRVRGVLEHYEAQTPEEAAAEDEAVLKDPQQAVIEVPKALIPAIRRLLARRVA